ncbi:MAG: hypothetical protein ACFE9Z_03565 [Promethearchaeota archaeon]
MNITEKYMDETIRAIGQIIKYEYFSLISVKKIRKLYKVEPLDYSKINFYWRSLQNLEKKKVIERYGSQSPKKYRVLNFLKFFDLLYDTCINQANLAKAKV